MRNHPALAAWLPTARQVDIVELLTVSKPYGSVCRYASSTASLVDGGHTYLGSAVAGGLLWQRSKLVFKAGVELSDCKVTFSRRDGDTINALPVASAIRGRIWDDATFTVLRAYFDAAGTLQGVLPRYQGQLAPVRLKDGDIEITAKPPSQTFNRAVPPVYQSACLNTVYDVGCGLDPAAWQVTGATLATSTAVLVLTGRGEAADYFAGGSIDFVGGALAGLSRTVRTIAAGVAITFFDALPAAPATGQGYVMVPGCNRSLGAAGCSRYANQLRYRGAPYIPLPETAF
jgi:uncharacterized phage protein (TIGR02218 family)